MHQQSKPNTPNFCGVLQKDVLKLRKQAYQLNLSIVHYPNAVFKAVVGKLLSLRTVGRSPEICEDDNVLASVVMAEEVGVAQS